jgi:ribosome-associated toxin RatA of RatAB toxin-antitoxin module
MWLAMGEVRKSVLLSHPCERMFDLVARVEDYPSFLPWCGGASVAPQPDGSKLATVQIAFKGLRQSFSTINRHLPPESIVMQLQQGPFKSLHGTWRFTRIRDDACRVELSLEYQFGAGLLGRALAPVFDHIAATMVDAFVDRADQLYGEAGK